MVSYVPPRRTRSEPHVGHERNDFLCVRIERCDGAMAAWLTNDGESSFLKLINEKLNNEPLIVHNKD